MTPLAITPLLVPPAAPARRCDPAPRRPLPLATVRAARPHPAAVFGLSAMDDRGRIADRRVLHALGWTPGTRLRLRPVDGLAMLFVATEGTVHVTSHGYLRLPASVSCQLDLRPGDRVLLTAVPARTHLLLWPPAALDALLVGPAPVGGAP